MAVCDLDEVIMGMLAENTDGISVRDVTDHFKSEGMSVQRNRVANHLTWMFNVGTVTRESSTTRHRTFVYRLAEVSE